jgi:hypothetical protein
MVQVAMEDFELCEKAQSNLAQGVYHEGILNPEKENGVSCTHRLQKVSKERLTLSQTTNNEYSTWSASNTDWIVRPKRAPRKDWKSGLRQRWCRWKRSTSLVIVALYPCYFFFFCSHLVSRIRNWMSFTVNRLCGVNTYHPYGIRNKYAE